MFKCEWAEKALFEPVAAAEIRSIACFVLLENIRLKVFRAVAEHLSFRKAGEALCLTQPAVTPQIKH
jgi:hypothetical protein